MQKLHAMFQAKEDDSWSFADTRDSNYLTHGYHRYPAKFVPQLVSKLINTYTQPGDRIADVFAGCGTTLVESKVQGRRSTGVDINPVAQFITRVKTQPIRPSVLVKRFEQLFGFLSNTILKKITVKQTTTPKLITGLNRKTKTKLLSFMGK